MKFISHRGNLNGVDSKFENHPDKINICFNLGYDVEVDVWYIENKFFLGHDNPQYEIDISFLKKTGLWCHAKNMSALDRMIKEKNIHCFWHQEDDYTLTSNGIIWCFPGKELLNSSVCVMPERASYSLNDIKKCYGVCSNNIFEYKEKLL